MRLSPVVGALRPLLPELASWLPLAPEPLGDRAAERHRVFRGLTELLGALGSAVLVLEDLHWADEQTVEFLSYLLAGSPVGLSVVLTFRGEDVGPGVRASVVRLPQDVNRADVTLGPLDVEETGALAAAIQGTERVSADFAEHLCARASGVPLAVEELLALLRARGTLARQGERWSRRQIDELDVPPGIRHPVLERVSGMSKGSRGVLEAAAVLAEPIPVAVLVAVSETPAVDAASGVDEALASGLLVEIGERVGFRHVLAAQAVYEAMPGWRRQKLHGRSAAALQCLDAAPLGQVAYHLRHAGRLSEWVVAAELAADRAIELGHDDEAARLLEDVLRHTPAARAAQRGLVAVKLAKAVSETHRSVPALIDLLLGVLDDDLSKSVRGELRFWLALVIDRTGDHAELRRRLLLEAVEDLDHRPDLKAWAMLGLGLPTTAGVPLAEHRRWCDRALAILPGVGEPAFEVLLLGKLAMALASAGDAGWRDLVARMVAASEDAPRGAVRSTVTYRRRSEPATVGTTGSCTGC